MAPSPASSTCTPKDEIILRTAEDIDNHLSYLESLAADLASRIRETKEARELANKAKDVQHILLPRQTVLVAVGDKEPNATQNVESTATSIATNITKGDGSKASSTTGCPGLTDASESFPTISGGDSANAAKTHFMRMWNLHKNNNKSSNHVTEADAPSNRPKNKYESLMSFLRQFGAELRSTRAVSYATQHFEYMSYRGDMSDDQLTEVINYMHSSDGRPTTTSQISTTIAITARPRQTEDDGTTSVHSGESSISAVSARAMVLE